MKARLNCGHIVEVDEQARVGGYEVCPECTKDVAPDGVALEAVREFLPPETPQPDDNSEKEA
jgi:hypothetical protein